MKAIRVSVLDGQISTQANWREGIYTQANVVALLWFALIVVIWLDSRGEVSSGAEGPMWVPSSSPVWLTL